MIINHPLVPKINAKIRQLVEGGINLYLLEVENFMSKRAILQRQYFR